MEPVDKAVKGDCEEGIAGMAEEKKLHAQVKLVVTASESRKGPSFGKGAGILLHGIEEYGSLNKTAKMLHMAYSKAWSMIKKVEEGLGFPLIERFGARGSRLTPEGKHFLELYDKFEKDVEDYTNESFERIFKEF